MLNLRLYNTTLKYQQASAWVWFPSAKSPVSGFPSFLKLFTILCPPNSCWQGSLPYWFPPTVATQSPAFKPNGVQMELQHSHNNIHIASLWTCQRQQEKMRTTIGRRQRAKQNQRRWARKGGNKGVGAHVEIGVKWRRKSEGGRKKDVWREMEKKREKEQTVDMVIDGSRQGLRRGYSTEKPYNVLWFIFDTPASETSVSSTSSILAIISKC